MTDQAIEEIEEIWTTSTLLAMVKASRHVAVGHGERFINVTKVEARRLITEGDGQGPDGNAWYALAGPADLIKWLVLYSAV